MDEQIYRGLSKVSPCWCKLYPPGAMFYGWKEGSLFLVSAHASSPEHPSCRAPITLQRHTEECIRQRQNIGLTEVFSWNNGSPDFIHDPVPDNIGSWRWKTHPLPLCYLLIHRYQTLQATDNLLIEVCQCGAERTISHNLAHNWGEPEVIMHWKRLAAYDKYKEYREKKEPTSQFTDITRHGRLGGVKR